MNRRIGLFGEQAGPGPFCSGEVQIASEDFDAIVGEETGCGGAVAPCCGVGETDLADAGDEGDFVAEGGVDWEG